jgi:hypothetical protein
LACSALLSATTGASTADASLGSFDAVADVSHGCADDVSSNSDPASHDLDRPSDPSATSCTHAPSGSIVNTMSEFAPARWAVGDRNNGVDFVQRSAAGASMSNTVNQIRPRRWPAVG